MCARVYVCVCLLCVYELVCMCICTYGIVCACVLRTPALLCSTCIHANMMAWVVMGTRECGSSEVFGGCCLVSVMMVGVSCSWSLFLQVIKEISQKVSQIQNRKNHCVCGVYVRVYICMFTCIIHLNSSICAVQL